MNRRAARPRRSRRRENPAKAQASAARHVQANRQIVNDGDLARRRLQLLVDAPLHEGVKTHAARLLGDEASDGGAARRAQWIGPAPPGRARALG